MTSAPGSWQHAGRIAAGELLARGYSRLTALVGGHVASFGDVCFQTDTSIREKIERPDGKRYHPESIARVRRLLRDDGVITCERVFTGARMPKAKFTSTRGTTLKSFVWRTIDQKNPFSRRQQRQRRQEQALAARAAGELVAPVPKTPRAAIVAEHHYTARGSELIDPEMAAAVARARELSELSEKRRELAAARNTAKGVAVLRAPGRPPPPD